MFYFNKKIIAVASLFLLLGLYSFTDPSKTELPGHSLDWIRQTGAKHFPQGTAIYNVMDYGAVHDGKTMTTAAIQKAIDACAGNGGGIVKFDSGTYLTGSIFIKSGVHLVIGKGVTLIGSHDIKDYPEIQTRVAGIEMKWPAALVNVIGQYNVAISGEGTIDGRGKPFWDEYWKTRKVYEKKGLRWIVDYDVKRPRTLLVQECRDVTIKDITLKRAGFWTVHILYSNYVTVNGITIRNNIGGHGPSTDGIDIDSSKYVRIEHCDVDCNDDDYCLKAGRDADGLRVNRPTEYVWIHDCIARAGGGLLTIGSETSGSIRHVLVEDSKAIGTSNGVNFKSAYTRGGTVSDIHVRSLKMEGVRTAIRVSMNWNPSYSYSKLPEGYDCDSIPNRWKKLLEKVPVEEGIPAMKYVYIDDLHINECKTAIYASGIKASLLRNFHLKNINIHADKAGKIAYARDWTFENVTIDAEDNSKVKTEHSFNVNP